MIGRLVSPRIVPHSQWTTKRTGWWSIQLGVHRPAFRQPIYHGHRLGIPEWSKG